MPEREVLAAARSTHRSAVFLRASLECAEGVWVSMIASIEAGDDPADVARTLAEAGRRCGVTAQLEEFIEDRHRMRLAVLNYCVARGMTLTEYAEILGVSRQQAQRMARKLDPPPEE